MGGFSFFYFPQEGVSDHKQSGRRGEDGHV